MKKKLKNLYLNQISYFLRFFLFKKPGRTPLEIAQYAADIEKRFNQFPNYPTNLAKSSDNEWNTNLNELKENVKLYGVSQFLNWPVVRRTMFITYADYSKNQLAFLKSSKEWKTRWSKAIHESQIGEPTPYPFYPKSSSNLIHHASHLASFEKWSNDKIEKTALVLEFGGGYGGMCRLFNQLNFNGIYIIYDLEHFSLIQSFYLKSYGLKQLSLEELESGNVGKGFCVIDSNDVDRLMIFLKNFKGTKTFVATWSLSEAPESVRQPFANNFNIFDQFIIAFQGQFNEVNNIQYFNQIKAESNTASKIEKISYFENSYYFFGKRNSL